MMLRYKKLIKILQKKVYKNNPFKNETEEKYPEQKPQWVIKPACRANRSTAVTATTETLSNAVWEIQGIPLCSHSLKPSTALILSINSNKTKSTTTPYIHKQKKSTSTFSKWWIWKKSRAVRDVKYLKLLETQDSHMYSHGLPHHKCVATAAVLRGAQIPNNLMYN